MSKIGISAFLSNSIGNALSDEMFDAILALRVVYPDWNLYDILHKLLRTGLETLISNNFEDEEFDLKKFLDSRLNPDLPY